MNKDPYCSCSCHIVKETNVICYSCLCDIEKMPKKQNTVSLDHLTGNNGVYYGR